MPFTDQQSLERVVQLMKPLLDKLAVITKLARLDLHVILSTDDTPGCVVIAVNKKMSGVATLAHKINEVAKVEKQNQKTKLIIMKPPKGVQ